MLAALELLQLVLCGYFGCKATRREALPQGICMESLGDKDLGQLHQQSSRLETMSGDGPAQDRG